MDTMMIKMKIKIEKKVTSVPDILNMGSFRSFETYVKNELDSKLTSAINSDQNLSLFYFYLLELL